MLPVTAAQMREVDRIAVEEFGLGVLQMMENAGRNLAHHAMQMLRENPSDTELGRKGQITILVGAGGNGGGGLCCARHLHNPGYHISLVLDRDPASLGGPAGRQLEVCRLWACRLSDRHRSRPRSSKQTLPLMR